MKKLRKIAGGDTYTIIYLKLQLLSLQHEGYLFFDGIEDTFAEELALILDEEVENVKVAIAFLEKCNLLEIKSNTEYLLTDVPNLIGKETQAAVRMRKLRQRQALTGIEQKNERNNVRIERNNVRNCYTDVRKCSTDIDIDIDIDKDIETDKEREKKEKKREEKNIDYQLIADMYNDTCVSLTTLTVLSQARKKAIRARLKNYSLEDFKTVFTKAENSTFLKGGNDRNWSANFDWLIRDSNMAKVLDGNYDDKKTRTMTGGNGNRVAAQLDKSYEMMADWAEKED